MKELRFKFDLDCKCAVYVPSTVNVSEECGNGLQEKFVKETMECFSTWFGGSTSTDAIGGWMTEDKKLVIESVKIVYSFCRKEEFSDNFEHIVSLCEKIKREMGQEAVTLEYNGQVKFI